jgi:hypothetical protein
VFAEQAERSEIRKPITDERTADLRELRRKLLQQLLSCV